MKKIVLGLITLSSISSFAACPDLHGSYPVCKMKNGGLDLYQNILIDQRIVNETTQYALSKVDIIDEETNSILHIADGISRTSTDKDGITVERSVSCEGDKLLVKETLFGDDGTKIYSNKTFYKNGTKLMIQSVDDWRNAGAGVIKSVTICE